MNRKAAALVTWTVLVMFIISLGAVIYYRDKGIDKAMEFGHPQREILETYAEGEAARQYTIYSAKYAAHQALYTLARNGGYESVDCPPYTYSSCEISIGGAPIDSFQCSPESPDARCESYGIDCQAYPCIESKPRATLNCGESEDGESIVCELLDKKNSLDIFECGSLTEGKCADYGAKIGEKKLPLKLNCKEVTEERECDLSECGNIGDYIYWYNGKSCFPDSEKVNSLFESLFKYHFDKFLYKYEIPMADNVRTLYDAVYYNLKISPDYVEGIPAKETYYDTTEDEEGNVIGEKLVEEESFMLFIKDIEDPKGLMPTVHYEYTINPYFKYELPFSPNNIFSKVRSKANSALSTIGSCSGSISSCASEAQESLAGDKEFSWKITGEEKDGANVVKFDVTPKGFNVFGVNVEGEIKNVQASSPIRFAVKYSGGVPTI